MPAPVPSSTAPTTRQILIASASLDAASAADQRTAMSRVQAFASNLRQQSRGDVVLLQQPFDTESDKTLKSATQDVGKRPAFRLQLTMPGTTP
jgi:hypothetical protein